MFCNQCGQALPDNATFCTNCGNRMPQPNQNVQQQAQMPNQNPQQFNQMPNGNFNQMPNQNPQQFNQMPNGNFNQMPYGYQMPQNVQSKPSPILKWLESAKDVFLSFFKKGYEEQPAKLLKENNHMWLVFAVVNVLLTGLSLLLLAVTATSGLGDLVSVRISKFPFFLLGFFSSAALYFSFATMLFVVAKIAKNNNVTYVNALNATSVAYMPIIFATVVSCIFNLFAPALSTIISLAAAVMFFVLIMKTINQIVANTSCENSFWLKTIAIICAMVAYAIIVLIITAIFSVSLISNFTSSFSGSLY